MQLTYFHHGATHTHTVKDTKEKWDFVDSHPEYAFTQENEEFYKEQKKHKSLLYRLTH